MYANSESSFVIGQDFNAQMGVIGDRNEEGGSKVSNLGKLGLYKSDNKGLWLLKFAKNNKFHVASLSGKVKNAHILINREQCAK